MKKSIFKKLGGLFLGLAMGLGVAVGVTAGNKASKVSALDQTINFDFSTSIPSGWSSSNAPTSYETTGDARGAAWNSKGTSLTYTLGTDYQGYKVTKVTVTASSNGSSRSVAIGSDSKSVASGTKHSDKIFETNFKKGDTITISVGGTNKTLWIEKIAFTTAIDSGGGEDSDEYTTQYIGDLEFDFSSNITGWPTTNSTTLTYYGYSKGADGNFKFGLNNVKCNSTYLMLTKVAVLELPSFTNSKLTKVIIKNSSGCSTSTVVSVTSNTSGTAVTGGDGQTWSTKSGTYTYTLSNTSTNTPYYLYVTSANAQIVKLTLKYESGITHTLGSITGADEVYEGKQTSAYSVSCSQSDAITWSVENGTGSATINSSTGVLTGGTAGTVTVKATCAGGGSTTKTVTIKADVETLKSISVSGGTREFTVGDNFSTTGLSVTGTYSHSNGDPDSTKNISSFTTDPSAGTKLNTEETKTVTVTAGGKTTTYGISVNYAAVTSITPSIAETTMGPEDEYEFTASVSPENANPNYSIEVTSETLIEDTDYMVDGGYIYIGEAPQAGDIIITFTATGLDASEQHKTCTTTIHVAAQALPTLVSFAASGTPTIANQYRNATFKLDLSNIVITGTYDNESTDVFTADQFEWDTTGEHPVGTYKLDESLTVTVSSITLADDSLDSIAFTNGCDMTNKEYWVGDTWNFAGLSITGTMKSGVAATIDTGKVSFTANVDTTSTGTTSILVTAHYQGFNGTEPTKTISNIKVKAITMDSLSVNYTGGQPQLGTDFVFAGSITANMSNGDTQTVATGNVTIGAVNKYTLDEQTITVTHKTTGATGTFKVQYKAKEIAKEVTWTQVTSVDTLLTGGTFIIGYEADATSAKDVIIPMGNIGTATTSAAGFMCSGNSPTDQSSSSNGTTITMTETGLNGVDTSLFEVTIGESTIVEDEIYIKAGQYFIGNEDTKNNCKLYEEEADYTAFAVSYDANSKVFTLKIDGDSRSYHTLQYNSGSPRFAVYGGTQKNLVIYQKDEQSSDQPEAIKLNVETNGTLNKNEGENVNKNDFIVSVLYDTGDVVTLEADDYSIDKTTYEAGDNTLVFTYGEESLTESIVVTAQEVEATLVAVNLIEDGTVKKSGYLDYDAATWDLTNLKVQYVWDDQSLNSTKTLQELVNSGEATISHEKPVAGDTSFTVSYSYLEMPISNGTVTLTEAVKDDYVSSISWTGTSASQFKAFEGDELTAATVNSWSVIPTFAGAGAGSKLSFSDYTLKIGEKVISSLPYVWEAEDDGESLTITYGKKADGTDYVRGNGTAVAHICPLINDISYTETTTGVQTTTIDFTKIAADKYTKQGTNGGTGGDVEITIDGFTFTSNGGYGESESLIKIYSGKTLNITSNVYDITGVSFTFSSGSYNGLSGSSSLEGSYSGTASKQTRIKQVTIIYNGTVTKTSDYANIAEHYEAQYAVVNFAKFMNETMNGENVCSGTFDNLSSAWEAVEAKYDELFGVSSALSEDELTWALNMLKYASGVWGSDEINACVEKAMKTYDHCVAQYGMDEFIVRANSSAPSRINPIANLSNVDNSVWVISAVALVGLTAIGGYFFYRKRKEI